MKIELIFICGLIFCCGCSTSLVKDVSNQHFLGSVTKKTITKDSNGNDVTTIIESKKGLNETKYHKIRTENHFSKVSFINGKAIAGETVLDIDNYSRDINEKAIKQFGIAISTNIDSTARLCDSVAALWAEIKGMPITAVKQQMAQELLDQASASTK